MVVEEDLEFLSTSSYFNHHLGKTFELQNHEHHSFLLHGDGSKKYKAKVTIDQDIMEVVDVVMLDDIVEVIASPEPTQIPVEKELVAEYERTSCSESDSEQSDATNSYESVSDTDDYATGSVSMSELESSDDENENEDEDEDEDEEATVKINDFPVQMICLEKCDGTLDQLFEDEKVDQERGIAFLFQIVMTLLGYQRAFQFTHNDLHTNNIMYVPTDEPYVWYEVDGTTYRVPTFGYIFKIIDFGRSIYHFQGRRFCSDSFASGGDGSTQYNCEPFLQPNKPVVEPNDSFDLCRLGCSIYDFIIDDQYDETQFDDLQRLIFDWCTDDLGKNILYEGKNGRERYPGFKLYRMIARKVHNHTPQNQLKRACFQQFIVDAKAKDYQESNGKLHYVI